MRHYMINSVHHWVWFPWVRSLGCLPSPFCNEDYLPFMPPKKKKKKNPTKRALLGLLSQMCVKATLILLGLEVAISFLFPDSVMNLQMTHNGCISGTLEILLYRERSTDLVCRSFDSYYFQISCGCM
jgi:hypothetical protein